MIALRFFETHIETVEIEKNILGATIIKDMKKIDTQENDKWHDVFAKVIQGKEVSILFPDSRTYYHRFSIPTDASEDVYHSMVLSKAKETIPEKSSELVFDYTKIANGNVLFVAVSLTYVKPRIDQFQKDTVRIDFGTSEPLALFHVLRSIIKKQDTVGYLDIGEKNSILTLYDADGPLFSFTEPLETDQLKEGVQKSLSYFEEKYVQEVSRIVIGGEKSLDIDYNAFADVFGERQLLHMDKVMQDIYKNHHIEFKSGLSSRILPPSFLGMALLYNEKEKINLLNKKNLEYIKSQQSRGQDKNPETVHSFLEKTRVPTISLDETLPEEKIKKTRRSRIVILLLILAILIVALVGLLYYRNMQKSQEEAENQVSPTPAQETEPTDTPTPQLERSELSIRVLNGTGEAGVASTAQELLESKGYEGIETDNADSFDFTETVIQLKAGQEAYRSLLEDDLADSYTVSDEEATLGDDEEVDAVIIIGPEQPAESEEDTPPADEPAEEEEPDQETQEETGGEPDESPDENT